jgi:hypothetical protein
MVHAKTLLVFACIVGAAASAQDSKPAWSSELMPPVQLKAGSEPIDIGKLSKIAHAGPVIADLDGDGKRDLLVGDFPGHFWLFKNAGSDQKPDYKPGEKLKAGGKDAKVPVY